MRADFVLFSFLSVLFLASSAEAQCRDDRGEPAPCVAETPLSAPMPVAAPAPAPAPTPVAPPPVEPSPETPNQTGHTHRESEVAYADFVLLVDVVDTRQLSFSPSSPGSVAEIARGATATGVGTQFESALGGLSLALGFRPVPWLRFPQLRLSAGFGDMDGATVDMVGGSQPLRATFHDLTYLRAELGAGLDLDLDPIRLYALGHVAIAGYFVNAMVEHGTVGDLGTDTFAEDTWEAGWTVGMEIELSPNVAYTVGYRHIHTGVESNSVFFGMNVRLD